MTTLIDKELFDYLNHLGKEVENRISETSEGSLQYLMHSQMKEIIDSEERFLKYINSNGTKAMLSISLGGLPSIDSLNPDLEKMCELAEDESSFNLISQKYKKGIEGKNNNDNGGMYTNVSEDKWNKELTDRKKEELKSEIGFKISEIDDGRFELTMKEDIYLNGYDKYSKEFPVLIREGKMRYHVVWNRLIDDSEESFYAPDTTSVLQGRPTKSTKKKFGKINKFYNFSRRDYKKYRGRMKDLWVPDNYSELLTAGTNARVKTTENILEAIERTLNRPIAIKDIRKNDLGQILAFPTVPFENAPKTTPICKLRNRPEEIFDLVFTRSGDKIGEIGYNLPYIRKSKYRHNRFMKDKIGLTISGELIQNEEEYDNLQSELNKVRKK